LNGLSDASTNERKYFDENALKFNDIAKEIFPPVYQVLAEQIIDECGITRGACIDVGSGPALLALELAKRTDLTIYAIDISQEILKIANESIEKTKLNGKVIPICGDVCAMPFKNGFADLVISRGSLPFWHDKIQAFHEIYRVLKVGGIAFVGGGFGRDMEVKNKIKEKMLRLHKEVPKLKKERLSVDHLQCILKKSQIPKFKIISDESGLWVKIEK